MEWRADRTTQLGPYDCGGYRDSQPFVAVKRMVVVDHLNLYINMNQFNNNVVLIEKGNVIDIKTKIC